MKISEVISKIRSRNKWLAEDSEITDRTLYAIAQDKAAVLIKQEFNKGRLLTSDNVFQVKECNDLKLVSSIECDLPAEICNKVRRTKFKLDGLGESEVGYSIQGVLNVVNSKEIYPTTIRQFIQLNALRIKPSKSYYIVKNGYIYVLNPDIENINVYVYSTEDLVNTGDCVYMGDREFKLPEYLKDGLYNMIDQSLINVHKFDVDKDDDNSEARA
jgi:hypothetical protein